MTLWPDSIVSVPQMRAFHLRRELQRLLFAAAETCWLYAILVTLGDTMQAGHVLSPFSLVLAHLAGVMLGRLGPRWKRPWWQLQALVVGAGAALVLGLVWLEIYAPRGAGPDWPGIYALALVQFARSVNAAVLATVFVMVAYARGLGLAQRPLTLWFVGFQFRLGVVILFLTSMVAAFSIGVHFQPWIFLYFMIALLGISLARIEEGGREAPLGWLWSLTLVVSTLLVTGLGLLFAILFKATAGQLFDWILAPFSVIFGFLFGLLLIPISYIADWLFQLLEPVLRALIQQLTALQFLTAPLQETVTQASRALQGLDWLWPFLRVVLTAGLVALAGLLLARRLNRRMIQYETEQFQVEAAPPFGPDPRRHTPRRSHPRGSPAIHADTIRRLYAAFLQLAAANGLQRREAETPIEFLPRAASTWPEASADMELLTRAYVAVHYGEQSAGPDEVRAAGASWLRARTRMTRK